MYDARYYAHPVDLQFSAWESLQAAVTHAPILMPFASPGYNVSYTNDKRYGSSGYAVSSSVEKIQTEIMTNGPVEGAFTVYADFPSYKSGK